MTILLLPAALLVGVWLHELAHAAAVWIGGGDLVAVDLWHLFVDYRPASERHEMAVRHAPFVVGLLTLPGFLAAVSASSAPLVAAVWIAFALTGGEGEVGVGALV